MTCRPCNNEPLNCRALHSNNLRYSVRKKCNTDHTQYAHNEVQELVCKDPARCNTQLAEQQVQQSARGLTCLSLARPRNAHVQNLWISQCSCLCASALLSHCSQGTAAESRHRWLQKLSCPHTPHGSQQPVCSPSTMPVRPILCVCTSTAVLRELMLSPGTQRQKSSACSQQHKLVQG